MRTHTARPLVLIASAVVLVLGMFIGFRLLTASAETTDPGPQCTNRTVKAGGQLTANLVKVNVYNVSDRSGLANRVSINLQRRGFLAGKIGNLETDVKTKKVTILTTAPDDPQVRLVARQFKGAKIHEPDTKLEDGVTIVVGDDYDGLADKAARSQKASRAVTVCVPTVDVDDQ